MENTLTIEHIRNAIKKLEEVSDNDRKIKEERRLKDWSKMADFYKEVENSNLPVDEKINIIYVIDMLAQGYYLVLGEYTYDLTEEYLKKLKVPQEVIDNIYKSQNLLAIK